MNVSARPDRPLRHLLPTLALLLAVLPAAAGERLFDDSVMVPDTTMETAARLENGRTWVETGPTWEIRLTRIDEDLRLQYLTRRTGMEIDPFRAKADLPSGYITFLLEMINTGEEGLIAFNPLKCWLKSDRAEVRTPLQMTDVSFKYRVAGTEMPVAYEHMAPALFDNVRGIPPGGGINGLLIYEILEKPRTRNYTVSVDLGLPDGNEVRFSAPYRALTKKERSEEGREEGEPQP